MKALLFIPPKYSLANTVKLGFEQNGYAAKIVNWSIYYPKWKRKLDKFCKYFTPLIEKNKQNFIKSINQIHLKNYYAEGEVDIVFIYNHDYFLPETLEIMKKKAKIIFFLGDNPLYSQTYDYNLLILQYADLIISPDSFWVNQLSDIGIDNVIFGNILDTLPDKKDLINKTEDLIYVGYNFSYNWGYKKLMFLDNFKDKINIYGSGGGWGKWLPFFPDLKEKFTFLPNRLSNDDYAMLIGKAKLMLIEFNPSLINGLHLRFFEALKYNTLPVVKYQKDIKEYFGDFKIPTLNDFDEPIKFVEYYSSNDSERQQKIKEMKKYLEINKIGEKTLKRILSLK